VSPPSRRRAGRSVPKRRRFHDGSVAAVARPGPAETVITRSASDPVSLGLTPYPRHPSLQKNFSYYENYA
jgi:hypothetical protein